MENKGAAKMITRMMNYFRHIKQQKLDKKYKLEKPPLFSQSPEFKPLTYDQKSLLINLVKYSKTVAWQGEFQWCVDASPSHLPPEGFIVGIKPVRSDTRTFDMDHPMFKNNEWIVLSQRAQMRALEDGGYISISSFPRQSISASAEETWVNFCLNQRAYDYFHFINKNVFNRFVHILWGNSQKQFVTIVISIISGVIGGFITAWLIYNYIPPTN
jgi:hypothetical protein